MSYMAKDGPDVTTKVLGDAEFNDKWGCKKNLDPDGSKGIHKEWRFGKCRDCGTCRGSSAGRRGQRGRSRRTR